MNSNAQRSAVELEELDRRQLGALVMRLSLACWQETTSCDRKDLARQSGLWNLYSDVGGHERTQTLDKYLSEKTFPLRPRWNRIYATACYVLSNCRTSSELCEQLRQSMDTLRRLN
ncbi:MAG: hypothetical protein C0620_00035 [Desulfuromonas sp.]|nr:MAG: hypothetical protein C0620_00035 [Desulfuromonas sp.]